MELGLPGKSGFRVVVESALQLVEVGFGDEVGVDLRIESLSLLLPSEV